MERWADIPGFEARYQVSDLGRVRSLPFMQRYLLRNGAPAMRRTAEKLLSLQKINSGYLVVQLWLDDVAHPFTVHRLVAKAFVPGEGPQVNHKDGVKTNNVAANLEWMTSSENHEHAVELGLLPCAVRVEHPVTGVVYPSISRAASECRVSHRTVRAKWARA